MNIPINEKKQGQCPHCGQWVNMIHNEKTLLHEITCCHKTYAIFIDKERLDEFVKEVERMRK